MTSDDLLRQGIAACKAGRRAEARELLQQVLELDERNETAWLWLSGAVVTDEDRRVCLENVLAINPNNKMASRGLQHLNVSGLYADTAPQVPAQPKPQPPVAPPAPPEVPQATPQAAPAGAPETVTHAAAPETVQVHAAPVRMTLPPAEGQAPGEDARKGKSNVGLIVGIVALVLVIGCVGVLLLAALGRQVQSQGPEATPTPTPHPKTAIIGVIRENIAATNAKDVERYMATIHPKASGRAAMRSALKEMFTRGDYSSAVYNVKLLEVSDEEARVSFTLITKQISGPSGFRDNQVDGVWILRKDDGAWKLYDQEVDNVTYLD
jgi:hypothetical protein